MTYVLKKLSRRTIEEGYSPFVRPGDAAVGSLTVIDPMNSNDTSDWKFLKNIEDIRPDTLVAVNYGGDYGIRTSLIRSIYIHNDENGQDKLILPEEFEIKNVPNFPELKTGDRLLLTLNSIYYLGEYSMTDRKKNI